MELKATLGVLRADIDRAVAWRLGATALLVVLGGLLAGLAPLALKGMVDTVGNPTSEGHASVGKMAAFAVAYLLALCSARLLSELRPPVAARAEQRLYARLRSRFMAHLLDLPLAFHRERQSGALIQILQQAILGYQIIVSNFVNSVVPVIVEVATVTLVLFALGEPLLTASFVMTALAYLLVLSFHGFDIGSSAREVSEANLDAHGMLTDSLLNVETIKCYGAEATTRARFDKATRSLERRWATFQQQRLRLGLTLAIVFALSMTAMLSVAIHAVSNGTISAGGFVLANVYMLQLARPLEMLGNAARDLSQAVAFIRPLMQVLSKIGESAETDKGSQAARANNSAAATTEINATNSGARGGLSLSFRDVCFAYIGGKPVLNNVNLDITAGRRVAIVGASGSGKSSLLRLLLRLDEQQSGCILLQGIDIKALPAHEVRQRIAVVPQDTMLFNETMAFNIAIGRPNATRFQIVQAARRAHLHEYICSLPLAYETVVGERGLKLSGGERQRIAIARAVLMHPGIYVFDEATSMLDSVTEMSILRNLRGISEGVTTVTVAHRLSTIQDADEIFVLSNGGVAEHGDHTTLLANGGEYAALWRAQQVTAA